ncbi:MAG: hypothetical protein Tsb0034_00750 [Ekhidna sp.]
MLDVWLFYALLEHPESFFWLKLILTPLLLVVAIAIARKGYKSSLRLTIGNNQLTSRYWLGTKKSYKISAIKSWHEEVVKSKRADYKQLTMVLSDGRVLQLSNQENSNYQQVVNYVRKKVKMKHK